MLGYIKSRSFGGVSHYVRATFEETGWSNACHKKTERASSLSTTIPSIARVLVQLVIAIVIFTITNDFHA